MPANEQIVGLILLSPLAWALFLGLLGWWRLWRARGELSDAGERWIGAGSVLASFISLAGSFYLMFHLDDPIDFTPLGIHIYIDALSLFFILIINTVALAASWNAISYLRSQRGERYQGPIFFHVLMNLFHFTMLLAPVVDNLVGLWIAIEATTLVSALLVAYPNTRRSWEAAWKYLIITSAGIILALMGTIFLAHGVHSVGIDAMDWSELIHHADQLAGAPSFILLAFLFVLAGYGVKAGLAPMHTWLPDAHGEAAPPISALFSGVLLKSAFYAILRYVTLTNAALGADSRVVFYLLMGTGLFSLMMAVPFILNRQNHFKRVMAYHSLEHMGIIVFGAGVGVPVAMFGSLLHALNHAVTKALMFLAHGNAARAYHEAFGDRGQQGKAGPEVTGVLQAMPITGLLLIIGGLALVGTPPFNIFMSLWVILWGSVEQVQTLWHDAHAAKAAPILLGLAVILFLFSTAMIYFGLVQHLARLVLGASPEGRRLKESLFDLIPLVMLIALVIVMGVWIFPQLANLIQQSVNIVLSLPQPPPAP